MTVISPGNENRSSEAPCSIDFESIQQLVSADLESTNRLILQELSSEVVLINQIGHHIISSGGKRLRPLLLILSAKALGYQGQVHTELAAIIEFIHTATLLHDDVVDESALRRGQDTANAVWGNAPSVLVGDFLYSRAFEMMVRTGNMHIMELMSRTTTAIAEGEVLQLLNCNNPETTEEDYLRVISRKTAILFQAAAQLPTLLDADMKNFQRNLADYGTHLGVAFQLVDDVLDYRADLDQLGKNLGDDLAEGKPTLPLIHAMQNTSDAQASVIKQAITEGDRGAFQAVYKVIQSTNSIEYTVHRAEQEAEQAIASIASLPASPYKTALQSLAQFSVHRLY